jgi:hypothetical protein
VNWAAWKALSGRQPWWWAILHAGKRIENRLPESSARVQMRTHRGPLLLHASIGCVRLHLKTELAWMLDRGLITYEQWPGLDNVHRGGIIGRCRVVGLITPDGDPFDLEGRIAMETYKPDMRWHIPGQWGHVLADVEPLPFVPCGGALGLWSVPQDVVTKLGLV